MAAILSISHDGITLPSFIRLTCKSQKRASPPRAGTSPWPAVSKH
jgi:hypothetical protein